LPRINYLLMNKCLLALASLFCSYSLIAQSYDMAVGVRLGTDLGISAKMRIPPIDENFTGEAILQTSLEREEGLLTVLGEQHFPLITRRVNLYAGAGAHVGWLENDPDRLDDYKAPVGISLIGGAEINFKNINISADFKPAVNISGGEKRMYSQTAVTLRYIPFKRYDIFESPRQKRKRKRQQARDQKRRERQAAGKKSWEFWKKG
jgi:ribosomal protein S21